MDLQARTHSIHFVTGLPRSGSTLLAALLNQNPRFTADVQSPLATLVSSALRTLSEHESSPLVSDAQRRHVIEGLITSFYAHIDPGVVRFDSNRTWSMLISTLAIVRPNAKLICCVRSPAWVLDSMERLVQDNGLRRSPMFQFDQGTVFGRAEALMNAVVGAPLAAVRTMLCGEHAKRVVLVPYDSLAERPGEVMAGLYEFLSEPLCAHKFESVSYEAEDLDDRLGLPGLHRVSGPVTKRVRQSILPRELFEEYDKEFWATPAGNPHAVPVL